MSDEKKLSTQQQEHEGSIQQPSGIRRVSIAENESKRSSLRGNSGDSLQLQQNNKRLSTGSRRSSVPNTNTNTNTNPNSPHRKSSNSSTHKSGELRRLSLPEQVQKPHQVNVAPRKQTYAHSLPEGSRSMKVLLEGSLYKEMNQKKGSYNKRYFVLKDDQIRIVLEYYGNHVSFVLGMSPRGSIQITPNSYVKLGGSSGESRSGEGKGGGSFLFSFCCNPNGTGEESRIYVLGADSQRMQDIWISSIEESISIKKSRIASTNTGLTTIFEENSNNSSLHQQNKQQSISNQRIWKSSGSIASNASGVSVASFTSENLKELLETAAEDLETRPPQQQEVIKASELIMSEFVHYDNPVNHFEFSTMKRIGRGAFGQVYVGTRTLDSRLVAIKVIKRKATTKMGKIFNEVAMMCLSKNPNVVECLGCFITSMAVWVIQEYMPGGDLTSIVMAKPPILNESHIAYICREVLKGLLFLHSNHRIHRDLKSDNVLLGLDGSIKLGDFGIAAQLTDEVSRRGSQVGTPAWMAPEVAQKDLYDKAADVWSFGIIILEMTDRQPPLLGLKKQEVIQRIISDPAPALSHPNQWSNDLRDFVSKALVKDATERATVPQLLQHPFISLACRKKQFAALVTQHNSKKPVLKTTNSFLDVLN